VEISPELIESKNRAEPTLLRLPGVTGVGIGARDTDGGRRDEPAVRIYVEDARGVASDMPREVGGVAVSLIEMRIEPCLGPDRARYDPLKGGIRISHPAHGFGTLGAIVRRAADAGPEPVAYGLTTCHVVGTGGESFPDVVWQPHEPEPVPPIATADSVGEVAAAEYPRPAPVSPALLVSDVDAAIFTLDLARANTRGVSTAIAGLDLDSDLVEAITESSWPHVGQAVRKRGSATGVTHGEVVDVHLTCRWTPGGPNCYLAEQAMVDGIPSSDDPGGTFCAPGDSGALVLDESAPTAVGLLYGRGDRPRLESDGAHGVFSKMRNVESALGVTALWRLPGVIVS